jgi:PhoPQ-activated pathogenicity-related protein
MFGRVALIFLIAAVSLVCAWPAQADLASYVRTPDSSFVWTLANKQMTGAGTVFTLEMTSQTWQGITWKHHLVIYQPAGTTPGTTMTLLNTGGGPGGSTDAVAMDLAKRAAAPVAVLYDVPNQPLLDGKQEDALIAETFVRYLKTGDDTWPLLLPMVKSVVRAMDALQAFSKQEWKRPIQYFVVTGASKRGWTSWLTAASGDPRVKAIAPMVIDTLNMPKQVAHQKESYGALSSEIDDYSKNGLTDISATPGGRRLLDIVDPYAYRKKLRLPKLILNGANDPYWSADALRLYWNDLTGDKWVTYVPNAGHNLAEKTADGGAGLNRALSALAAFIRSQSGGPALARLRWDETAPDGKSYRIMLTASTPPRVARLWVARAATRDFRQATWQPQPLTPDGKTVLATLAPPASGHSACFAELEFGDDGATYTLCTPIRVL